MRSPRLFLESPLGRHPFLLVRKVAARLGVGGGKAAPPPPPVSAAVSPAHWAAALRGWISHVPLHPPPHPYNRVFGQEFDEAMLLRLCREGPPRGKTGLASDIKLVWDYSRAHALFTNAATGPEQLEAGAAFVRRWLEANADTSGPAWSCAMDVALRAVNWVFADVLYEGQLGARVGASEWAGWLWRHGWLTWRHLEARLISSNHYLADLLGLAVVSAVFPGDPEAQRWRRFARDEFPRALLAQTRGDGGLGEASLRYHAFVTEMALVFRLSQGTPFPADAEARLGQMCRIVADFRDASGDVFALGDDDTGRVLGLDFASGMGRADVLSRLAESLNPPLAGGKAPGMGDGNQASQTPRAGEVLYAESGWWVSREDEFVCALDFGGVGMHGMGAHAHNDDLSFCLEWRGRPVIVDPGTCLYTSDPEARNRFRSTLSHNTVMIDGQEQREAGGDLFMLPGPDEALQAERLEGGAAFTRPLGPARHRREIVVRGSAVAIRDHVDGSGRHRLQWRFHLHPGVEPSATPQGVVLTVPDAGNLLLSSKDAFSVREIVQTEYSSGYGRREPARAWTLAGEFELPHAAEFEIRPTA